MNYADLEAVLFVAGDQGVDEKNLQDLFDVSITDLKKMS